MPFLNIINQLYTIEDAQPRDILLNKLQSKIEAAKSLNEYIPFKMIDYKKFTIDGNKIIIDRDPSMFTPWRGVGTISLDLTTSSNRTSINVLIEPYSKAMLQTALIIWAIIFILITTFCFWISSFIQSLIIASVICAISLIIFKISMVRNRWSLEFYIDALIKDLNISGNLEPVDRN